MPINRENIQATIRILERARDANFDMRVFQGFKGPKFVAVASEDELHACGNTACIAGYVALSPEWKEFGGIMLFDGRPAITIDSRTWAGTGAMEKFWGLDMFLTHGIVTGEDWFYWRKQFPADFLPKFWQGLTRQDAIRMFQFILDNPEKFES